MNSNLSKLLSSPFWNKQQKMVGNKAYIIWMEKNKPLIFFKFLKNVYTQFFTAHLTAYITVFYRYLRGDILHFCRILVVGKWHQLNQTLTICTLFYLYFHYILFYFNYYRVPGKEKMTFSSWDRSSHITAIFWPMISQEVHAFLVSLCVTYPTRIIFPNFIPFYHNYFSTSLACIRWRFVCICNQYVMQ